MIVRKKYDITSGLRHFWRLDSSSYVDLVGGWNGTLEYGSVGIRQNVAPDKRDAVDFSTNGLQSSISTSSRVWRYRHALSASAWFNADVIAGNFGNWIVNWRLNGTNNRYFQIAVRETLDIRGSFWDSANTQVNVIGPTISTGRLYHVVVTSNLRNKHCLYLGGKLAGKDTTSMNGTFPSGTAPLAFGDQAWSSSSNDLAHNGIISQVGIWDRVLSAQDVKALYNNGRGRIPINDYGVQYFPMASASSSFQSAWARNSTQIIHPVGIGAA